MEIHLSGNKKWQNEDRLTVEALENIEDRLDKCPTKVIIKQIKIKTGEFKNSKNPIDPITLNHIIASTETADKLSKIYNVIVSGECVDADDGAYGQHYFKSTVLPILTVKQLEEAESDYRVYSELLYINKSQRYQRNASLYGAVVPVTDANGNIMNYVIKFIILGATDSSSTFNFNLYIAESEYEELVYERNILQE